MAAHWFGMLFAQICSLHPTALAAKEAGLVASQAEKAKIQKYALLKSSHYFAPVAIEMSSVFGPEAISSIKELGQRIRAETGEPRSLQFLLQGFAVANVATLQQ